MSRFVHFFVWICALFCLDLCTLCEAAEERSLPISLRVTGGSSHPDTAARSSDGGDGGDVGHLHSVVCRQDLKSRLGQGGRCQLLLLLQSTKVKLFQTIPKQEYEYNVVLLSQAGHLSRS